MGIIMLMSVGLERNEVNLRKGHVYLLSDYALALYKTKERGRNRVEVSICEK